MKITHTHFILLDLIRNSIDIVKISRHGLRNWKQRERRRMGMINSKSPWNIYV